MGLNVALKTVNGVTCADHISLRGVVAIQWMVDIGMVDIGQYINRGSCNVS